MAKKDSLLSTRIIKLRELLTYHHHLYHLDDAPEISDQAYDALSAEMKELEIQAGITPTITEAVGATPSAAFSKVRHAVPQWSFDNVFTKAELADWEGRLARALQKNGISNPVLTYVCEHKIDGLKAVIEYRKGVLYRVLTRGDGEFGEDVTHTAATITSLPEQLPEAVDLLCVGEVWLSKDNFKKINVTRAASGEALFANPRNAAAGSLRQLKPEVAKARGLSLYVYDIDLFTPISGGEAVPLTQSEELKLLKRLGLPVNPHSLVCTDRAAILAYYQKWQDKYEDLAYGVDGVVIKLDEVRLQKVAGYTAKSPRFGVAFKFPAVEKTTLVEAIELQVGRTGVITPVAHLTPVLIDGSTVARATLHNEDQIKRLDVRVGDTVILRKAGDVIPEIVSVLKELRPAKSTPYRFPPSVLLCGGDGRIERVPGTAAYRCVSLHSDFLNRQRLYYFVGKTALNIDGIGPKIIDALLDAKLITDAADLYALSSSDFLKLPGFKEKSAENAVEAILKARTVTFSRLLVGLSLEQVGEETARLLALNFETPQLLLKASHDALAAINGIGGVVAGALTAWQKDDTEQVLFAKLLDHVSFSPELNIPTTGTFSGQSLLFTGTLQTIKRNEAEAMARAAGAKIVSAVSKATNYLVAGESAGSKLDQAKKLGIPVLSEKEFLVRVAE